MRTEIPSRYNNPYMLLLAMLVTAILIGSIVYLFLSKGVETPSNEQITSPKSSSLPTNSKKGQVCIQVITEACNPATGECREFGTPCDVPDGWVKKSPTGT